MPATVLIVAKAPVPGFAKTRLTPPLTPLEAARLAAAALLDTLTAAHASGVRNLMVAWTGDLEQAEAAADIAAALREFTVVPQRGETFGQRLANAHADAARFGQPVLQIGMDTPQAGPELLTTAAAALPTGTAALGPAADGGWWALGLSDPRPARALADIPMSTSRTGELTRNMLQQHGYRVHRLPILTDVDDFPAALSVASEVTGRFADAVRSLPAARLVSS
ncbi:DUF2064 domain-containing protein [Nocardia puris]|nr:DUF2064 domain-containing protein [Nocardia puris]